MVPHGYSAYGARDNRSEREFGPLHRSGHISLHDCRDVSGNGGDQSRDGRGSPNASVFSSARRGHERASSIRLRPLFLQRYCNRTVDTDYQFVADLQAFEIFWVPRFDGLGRSIGGFYCHGSIGLIDCFHSDKQIALNFRGATWNLPRLGGRYSSCQATALYVFTGLLLSDSDNLVIA